MRQSQAMRIASTMNCPKCSGKDMLQAMVMMSYGRIRVQYDAWFGPNDEINITAMPAPLSGLPADHMTRAQIAKHWFVLCTNAACLLKMTDER